MADGDIRTDDKVWYEHFLENYMPEPQHRIGDGQMPSPTALIHVSLGTDKNFEQMCDFYIRFFNCKVTNFRDKRAQGGGRAAFITFDEFDHRFAILERSGYSFDTKRGGIAHIAFKYASLKDLMRVYQQAKDWEIAPIHCINHGQSTSIYYHDPDKNEIETYIDNFDTPQECTHWKHWYQYRPGTDFDMSLGTFNPDDMAKLVAEGYDEKILRNRDELIKLKNEGKIRSSKWQPGG